MFRARFISGLRDFTRPLTSAVLRARLVIEIWIHSADACILAMSCVGYARVRLKTLSSILKHPSFVEEAIEELLNKRCIEHHDTPPHVVNPLTVAKGKKIRLVLDLRYVINFFGIYAF